MDYDTGEFYDDGGDEPPDGYDAEAECNCGECMAERSGGGGGYGHGAPVEAPLSHRATLGAEFRPFASLLRTAGTRWSAEIELVGISIGRSARVLECESGYYSETGGSGEILACGDATVDVEVKLSRMRDGNPAHAVRSADAYDRLRNAGGYANTHCGHHVHVDASRFAESQEVAQRIVRNAVLLGAACDRTLTALAAVGFDAHRESHGNSYGGDWNADDPLGDRSKLHGNRLLYAVLDREPSRATVEYRLPNGTAHAERAHAHVAIALGLVDLAHRAETEREAAAAVQAARDGLGGWQGSFLPYGGGWPEGVGAAFLRDQLALSDDSLRALAAAACDAPTSADHRRVWADAAAAIGGSVSAPLALFPDTFDDESFSATDEEISTCAE